MARAVFSLFGPIRRDSTPLTAASGRRMFGSARTLLLVVLVSALVCGLAGSPVLAQNDHWGGTVKVSSNSISVNPGESTTYKVWLSKPPTEIDGSPVTDSNVEWFVMLHIGGVRYSDGKYRDLTIVPGFYRTFTKDDWNQPKDFRITRKSKAEWDEAVDGPRADPVQFTHEVWDHYANCPVHGRGPVNVHNQNSGGGSDGTGGNSGNGGNGGSAGGNGGNGENDGNDESDGNGGNGGNSGSGGRGPGDTGGRTEPTLSISDAMAPEGEALRFQVTLSALSDRPVSAHYRTAGRTAIEGMDYEAASGTLKFPPNTRRQTVRVRTIADDVDEPDETFRMTLSDPLGATLQAATGTGTIINDDAPPPPSPTLSISDASGIEGGVLRFRVMLSRVADGPVTVDYRTAGNTATQGTDYEAASGTLTFDPGTMAQTVGISSREDAEDEPDETFRMTLSNPLGATLQAATGTGTIIDDDDFQQRLQLASRAFLPEMARALAFNAVTCRVDQIFSSTVPRSLTQAFGTLPLPAPVPTPWIGSSARSINWKRLLGNLSFAMPSNGDANGSGRIAAWSCGEFRGLRNDGADRFVDWNGRVVALQFGADIRFRPDLVAGLSLSRSGGRFDYSVGSGAAKAGGNYELRLTGIHPYLVWSVSPGLAAWTTIGLARGELEVSDDIRSALQPRASTLGTGALGIRGRVLAHEMKTVTLKGEAAFAQLGIADGKISLGTETIGLQRLRFMAEAAYEHPLASGRSLVPWGEIGLRSEGGDGKTGSGVELGGGLRFQDPEKGWTVEGFGRRLITSGALPKEWGFDASVSFNPDPSSAGLSARLSHSWGWAGSGVRRLWEEGSSGAGSSGDQSGRRLELKVDYGFSTMGGHSMVTPFGAVTLGEESGHGYRWGGRFEIGPTANLSLEFERREQYEGDKPVHAIMLRGAWRF